MFFITITVIDWIDVFTRPAYKHIVINSLSYCQKEKGLKLHGWCLMTNHLHMIVSTTIQPLCDIIRDFKKFTSKEIVKAIINTPQESRKEWITNRFQYAAHESDKIQGFKFWQDGYYIEQIFTLDFFQQKLNYIHMNPVKQEFVRRPECYLYSSARDYSNVKGLLHVDLIK